MIADLAAINHWPLAVIEALPLDELIAWRNRAVERWNRMNRTKE